MPGVHNMLRELERSLYLLVAPAVKILTRFMLRTELPKFLKGFLVQVNQTVHVYYKFLERRTALLARTGSDDADEGATDADGAGAPGGSAPGSSPGPRRPQDASVELFLCSELQRNQDLHSALALTAEPSEVGAARLCFALAALARASAWFLTFALAPGTDGAACARTCPR